MAGCVDEVELIGVAVMRLVHHAHGMGLDGDAALAFEIHVVQNLRLHFATGDGVDPMDKQGAGDQGLMFGYACLDTPELMPLPIHLAHRLAERLSAVRKSGEVAYLRPDGKTQVTISYDGDKAIKLDTVVLSTQHAADISLQGLLEMS